MPSIRMQRKGVIEVNPGNSIRRILLRVLCLVAAVLLTSAVAVPAAEKGRGEEILLDSYRRNLAELQGSSFGLPIILESSEQKDTAQVDVYGVFDYPFGSVANALGIPAHWCDIVAMSPNVKACTYGKKDGDWQLTLYVGRKVYRAPEDARRIIGRFTVAEQRQGYLDVVITADKGPYGTRNYRLRFQAVPLAEGKTFVHVGFEYRDSALLHMAEKAYFATLGRNKTGFTVIGRDEKGTQLLVGGRRGAIERNTVLYYLAISSFLKMLPVPADQRFSRSIAEWYQLTTRYRQLDFGQDRKEYLEIKARERRNQLTLQQRIGRGR